MRTIKDASTSEEDLQAIHCSQRSFYGKARVLSAGGAFFLESYGLIVAAVYEGILYRLTDSDLAESRTSQRHIREFARQFANNESRIDTVREWRNMNAFNLWIIDKAGDLTGPTTHKSKDNYLNSKSLMCALGGKEYWRGGMYHVKDPAGKKRHIIEWLAA